LLLLQNTRRALLLFFHPICCSHETRNIRGCVVTSTRRSRPGRAAAALCSVYGAMWPTDKHSSSTSSSFFCFHGNYNVHCCNTHLCVCARVDTTSSYYQTYCLIKALPPTPYTPSPVVFKLDGPVVLSGAGLAHTTEAALLHVLGKSGLKLGAWSHHTNTGFSPFCLLMVMFATIFTLTQ
jgi:hypothetical protein